MLSNPRIGLAVSIAISALSAAWLLVQHLFGDALNAALGMNRHAITLIAIVLLVTGLAAAAVFGRFQQVKSDLLAGRRVIAEWTVDKADFAGYAAAAGEHDRADRMGALMAIVAFTVLVFGAVAVFDPEAAAGMLLIGGCFLVVIVAAFFYGNRVRDIQMVRRSGRVIVGRDGLMVNGVLHVWVVPLTWLTGAELVAGTPAMLAVTYAVFGRAGPQLQTVVLPVPETSRPLSEKALRELNATARRER